MSNFEQPIKKKSPERIAKIADAKARKSLLSGKRMFTTLWTENPNLPEVIIEENLINKCEIGFLTYWRNSENWTVLTTHQIFGKQKGTFKKIDLKLITSNEFGMFKGLDYQPGILQVNYVKGQETFEYELNFPGLMLRYGLDIFTNHWSRNAVVENEC